MDLELVRVAVVPVLLAVVPAVVRVIAVRPQARIGVIERENAILTSFEGSPEARQLLVDALDQHVEEHNWATLRRIDGANLAAAFVILAPLAAFDGWLIRMAFDLSGWQQIASAVGALFISILVFGFSAAAGKRFFREPKKDNSSSAKKNQRNSEKGQTT